MTLQVKDIYKVLLSQRPWLTAEKRGKFISGHCAGMTGLGETCTHVNAILLNTLVMIRDSGTVTYWKLPNKSRDNGVAYLPISYINFTSARSKRKQHRLNIQVNSGID